MQLIVNWIVSALSIVITAYILPGIRIKDFQTALLVAVVLGILNAMVRPLLLILTLPINIVTLGLFTFVINAFIILITSSFISGFQVENFWWAILFSIFLSFINSFLHKLYR